MNRPALAALRDAMRQSAAVPVTPWAMGMLLDALLAPDDASADRSCARVGHAYTVRGDMPVCAYCGVLAPAATTAPRPVALWETA